MVKVTATAALNMYVPLQTKERAVRLRRATGRSFPQLAADAWQRLEDEIVAKMTPVERERYFGA
jgi:hypothetical protein